MRGPGEILGTRQTGLADLKIADLVRDQSQIPRVQQLARQLYQQHPELVEPLLRRWLSHSDDYAQA